MNAPGRAAGDDSVDAPDGTSASRVTLTVRQPLASGPRIDLRGVTPAGLAGLGARDIERLTVVRGNERLALAELFTVDCPGPIGADGELVIDGDVSRVDRIGWQLAAGRIVVTGAAGDLVGGCMTGGALRVRGNAGLATGCEMAGGALRIDGDVGDHAAGPLPGSLDGMRGGVLVVGGRAGDRFGDRMRRGTAIVVGDVGDFLASRLVAGTIAVGGRAGAHVGYGMRRGSVIFAGSSPPVPARFVPALADAAVAWQLLARDLARHGGPFADLARRRIVRHLGDPAADGRGELIAAPLDSR